MILADHLRNESDTPRYLLANQAKIEKVNIALVD
jgi:hypothetical protein